MRNQLKINVVFPALFVAGILNAAAQGQINSDNPIGGDISSRNNGSATTLSGSACIYHIFVADKANAWEQNDIEKVVGAMHESLRFISHQARLHGHNISFVEETAGIVTFENEMPTDIHSNPAWTERVIKAVGLVSGNEMMEKLRQRYHVDHAFIILHVNKAALSYNLTYYDRVDPIFKAERSVCFTEYPDGRSTAAATYAHEILHVFGAQDLYFPYDKDDFRHKTAQRLYPDDIMLRVDYDISNLTVGDFTAYCVGWLDTIPEGLDLVER